MSDAREDRSGASGTAGAATNAGAARNAGARNAGARNAGATNARAEVGPPLRHPSSDADVFMSVPVCKRVMTSAKAVLLESGIDPDDTELGIPLRGMAYRAMTDVNSDPQCAGMGSGEKAVIARDIVARFYSEVARASRATGDSARLRGSDGRDHRTVRDVDFGDPARGSSRGSAGDFYRDPARGSAAGNFARDPARGSAGNFARGSAGGDSAGDSARVSAGGDSAGGNSARGWAEGNFAGDYAGGDAGGSAGFWAGQSASGPTPRSLADPIGGGPLGYSGVVTQRQCRKRLVSRYLLANGYDRDWTLNPNRYSWTAKITSGDSPFVDVRSLAATCLIVPREVYDEQSNAGYTFVPKTNYRHAHGLPFPYLILNLAGFQNLYKSTSAASSKAFAHFVFHSFYSSPNGRDYIRLEPVQYERLTFDINPLSQLSQLEISIQQPSGALLNGSRDDLRVKRIRYADATATFNQDRRRLLVELASHFDKNEFFRNDTVRFSGFFVPGPAGAAVNAFVNRPEGHRIVDMLVGTHADDMVDGFYVQVMGDYDPATGDFETDDPAIAALHDFNEALDDAAEAKAAGEAASAPAQTVPYFDYLADEVDSNGVAVVANRNYVSDGRVVPGDLGRVINASLQCTVSFRVEVEEDDVSTVGAPPLAGEGSFSPAAGPPRSRLA